MNEVTRYKAIRETRELTREGFGLMGAAELAAKLSGHPDPVSLALQAGQAELACARCRADLLAASCTAGDLFRRTQGDSIGYAVACRAARRWPTEEEGGMTRG